MESQNDRDKSQRQAGIQTDRQTDRGRQAGRQAGRYKGRGREPSGPWDHPGGHGRDRKTDRDKDRLSDSRRVLLLGHGMVQEAVVILRFSVLEHIGTADPAGRGGEFQHVLQVLTTEEGFNSGRWVGG